MRGVVRAEVLKFGVLAVSLGAVVSVLCLRIEGGMLHAWRVAAEGGRLRALDGSLDPTVTFASAWVAIGYFFQNLSSYGADQMAVQRYLTSRSIRESRRAVVFCSWSLIPINLMIAAIGALAYVFYRQHPELGAGLESGDYVLPHFAVHQLPRGLSGLVIANILSLSLTTHSAGLHSVNTVVMNDLVERFVRRDLAPRHHVRLARLGTVFWGAVTIVLALHVPALGSIVVASQKVSQFFGGVLLGIFLLGMLSRRTGSAAAALGALAGMGCVALAGRFTNVSYFWYAPLGCLATMASGYVTGLILPAPAAERTDGLCLAWRRKGRGPSSGTRF